MSKPRNVPITLYGPGFCMTYDLVGNDPCDDWFMDLVAHPYSEKIKRSLEQFKVNLILQPVPKSLFDKIWKDATK